MKTTVRKRTGGLLPALGLGVGAAVGITLLLAIIFAYAMEREMIGEKNIGFLSAGILILAAASGALIASGLFKSRRMLVCLGTGGVYFIVLLLLDALFFGGDFGGLPVTAGLVCGSSAAAGLIGAKSTGSRKKKYKRYKS